MIKIDIVKQVARESKIKDREALAVIDTIIDALKQIIHENQRIEIRNFGVFQIKQRQPRTGRNPRDKKEYPILSRRVVTFKLGKELKDFSVKSAKPGRAASGSRGASRIAPSPETQAAAVSQPSFLANDPEKT